MQLNDNFGYDFLLIMEMISLWASGSKQFNLVASAASMYFLTDWDFPLGEVTRIEQELQDDLKSGHLNQPDKVFERLTGQVMKYPALIDKLVVQSIAIANIVSSNDLSADVWKFLDKYRTVFDYKPEEFDNLIKQGVNMSAGLLLFARVHESVNKETGQA
jgi:hypothetical protein